MDIMWVITGLAVVGFFIEYGIAYWFKRRLDMAIFLASRRYESVPQYKVQPDLWLWHVPQSERMRLENDLNELPRKLTLEDAYRRAKLEEERERLQLPHENVVAMTPRQVDWR